MATLDLEVTCGSPEPPAVDHGEALAAMAGAGHHPQQHPQHQQHQQQHHQQQHRGGGGGGSKAGRPLSGKVREADAEVARTMAARPGPDPGPRSFGRPRTASSRSSEALQGRAAQLGRRWDRPLPGRLNRLLNLAHAAHAKRLKSPLPGTSLYDEFERRGRLAAQRAWTPLDHCTTPVPGRAASPGWLRGATLQKRSLEIICQFDAHVQKGDQRGQRGKDVYPTVLERLGPVYLLFKWYAKRDEYSGSLDIQALPRAFADMQWLLAQPDEVLGKAGLMNQNELLAFAEDFEIVPDLLSRYEVVQAFKRADSGLAGRKAANNRPHELCYPEFLECLLHMALTAYGKPQRRAAHPSARAKVVALQEHLGIASSDTRSLRNRLAALQRLSRDRAAKAAAKKWDYIKCQTEAATFGTVRTNGQTAARAPEAPVSEELMGQLLKYDVQIASKGEPQWVEFAGNAIDVGVVPVGAARKYRVVIRNRGGRKATIQINAANLPFASLSYSESPLPPGLPRVIEIDCAFRAAGEWLGTVGVSVMEPGSDGPAEEHYPIPVYARAVVRDLRGL